MSNANDRLAAIEKALAELDRVVGVTTLRGKRFRITGRRCWHR